MSRVSLSSFIFLILVLASCGFSTEKRRPDNIQQTIEDRAVKKVSEADIINKTKSLGDSITKIASAVFLSKIGQEYQEGGYEKAVEFCNMNAYPLTDSLAKQYKIYLSRVSNKNRNPSNKPSGLEKEILEAYEYSSELGDELGSNVQFVRPGDTILYNKPIRISSQLCLNCHGSEQQLSASVKEMLKEKYPKDKATGYEIGDLRGMWSVKFLKKEIVKQL